MLCGENVNVQTGVFFFWRSPSIEVKTFLRISLSDCRVRDKSNSPLHCTLNFEMEVGLPAPPGFEEGEDWQPTWDIDDIALPEPSFEAATRSPAPAPPPGFDSSLLEAIAAPTFEPAPAPSPGPPPNTAGSYRFSQFSC